MHEVHYEGKKFYRYSSEKAYLLSESILGD